MMLTSYFPSIFLLPLLWQLSAARPQASTSSVACNNSPALCSQSYGNITHLGAHDSPFLSNETNKYTSSGNQFYNTTTQLNAGVRLLSVQIHTTNSSTTELRLCHSDCSLLDAGSLVSWLSEAKAWMDANPNEVVTLLIVNSVNADAARLAADFTASGVNKYAYSASGGVSSWPTLQSMISANTRLVTFVASLPSGNAAAPYLLDEFTYVWENPYSVLTPSNFSCLPDRPAAVQGNLATAKSSGRLFLMNHFLDKDQLFGIQIPDVDNAGTTNSGDPSTVGSLGNAAQTCRTAYGKAPTFILVDWFNVGPAINTVDGLNGVTNNIVGRKSVSPAILSQGFTGDGNNVRSTSTLALVLGFAVAAVAGWI